MKRSTISLHEKLIRLLKGLLSAWEEWLQERQTEETLSNK
jgi:hypothetical protein